MAFVIARVSDDETLYSRALETAFGSGNRALQLPPRISQWATRVVQFSSEGKKRHCQAAQAALGPPELSPDDRCGSWLPIWYPSTDRGEQYIRVDFAKPVRMPEIVVHEAGNNMRNTGFVRKLILWDTEGNSVEYRVEDKLRRCPGASRFELHRHPAAVAEVTVVIDADHAPRPEGIDTIQLVGVPLE